MRSEVRALAAPPIYPMVATHTTGSSWWFPVLAVVAGVGFAILLFGLAHWPLKSSA